MANPLDPTSLIPAGLGALQGIGNIFFSGRKKREKELEDLASKAPRYGGDNSVSSYYQTALQMYGVDPTNTSLYKRSMNNIGKNTAAGISALSDRRSGLTGVAALSQGAEDAALNAEVQAENQKNQRFNELGGATQMQNQDNLFKFKTNTLDPYQLKLSLASMKAQAANSRYNNGQQSLMNGVNNGAAIINASDGGYNGFFGRRKQNTATGVGYEDPRI